MKTKNAHMTEIQAKATQAVELLKLLANPTRLVVLCQLISDAKCVGALEEIVGISQSALSQHLAKMRAEGIVHTEKIGQQVFYRIADPKVGKILNTLYEIYCDPREQP